MRTGRFWWLALSFFGGGLIWYAVQVHQTKYLVEIGFSPMLAAWSLGLVAMAGIPGQIVLGGLSRPHRPRDRLDDRARRAS